MAETDKILCNEEKETEVTYTYIIDKYPHESMCNGEVEIIFINGVFQRAKFPFQGTYNRHQWEVLSSINNKIQELRSAIVRKGKGK